MKRLVVLLSLSLTVSALAATHQVPLQFNTIQLAMDAAADGDTILVSPGSYLENINFAGRSVALISTDGAEATEIRVPGGSEEHLISFPEGSGPGTLIEGFTLDGNDRVRCISSSGSSPTVQHCIIQNGYVHRDGGGAFFEFGAPQVLDNVVRYNHTQISGGGICVRLGYGYGTARVIGNICYGNKAPNGPAITMMQGEGGVIERNVAVDNYTDLSSVRRGAIFVWADNVNVWNNTSDGNSLGMTILSSANVDARNNIITNNPLGGFELQEDVGPNTGLTYDYNDVWNNGSDDYIDASPAAHDLAVDPQLYVASTGPAYLSSGSPCIDAGDPAAVFDDPDGSRNDVGARPYENAPPAVCGDGVIDWGEACDDGNLVAGDGCDPICRIELGDSLINLVQWPVANGGNDHWYAVLVGERYWIEADSVATGIEHDGFTGYLATVTSPAENDYILTQVLAGTDQPSVLDMFWLGGRDVGLHWVWLTGEPFVYTNWSLYEPNNIGIETALGMWGHHQTDYRRIPGKWNNSLPDSSVNPLARFWAVVEWGIPDTTLPDPVCGNGILEWGEECDDGNLIAGDGCDPLCLEEEEPQPDDQLINLVQWREEDGGNDHWYAVLTGEDYWVDAYAKMDTLLHDGDPGYLATVTSPQENQFILDWVIAGTNQPSVLDMFWLGGRDINGWLWVNSEPFVYQNWSIGEPNNQGIETALGIWGHNQNDPRRIPGKWNNALPDPTVNPLSRFWSLVEWGEPDSTLPPPVCGNGIVEIGEECDDGNLVAGDGCDPVCMWEEVASEVTFVVDTDTGNGTLYVGEQGSIVFSVMAPTTMYISAYAMPMVYHFSNGNVIGPITESGSGAQIVFSAKAQSVFEALPWNPQYGEAATNPDTTLLGCLDFGGTAWTGSGEIWRLTFVPLATGTIVIDSATVPPGTRLEVVDANAQQVAYTWDPVTITVVEGMPTGDVNGNDVISSSDIVSLVGYIFKGTAPPVYCDAIGDVDCSGYITTADLLGLVNFVFRDGPRPCNAGELVEAGVWFCP